MKGNGPDHLRYMRRRGNRRVRARRRRRSALRVTMIVFLWCAGAAAVITGGVVTARWTTSPRHFLLSEVEFRGHSEARVEELRTLVQPWMGSNIFNIDLGDVESSIRTHPWIGKRATVRIQRRLPGAILVTLRERQAAGLALVDGVVVLVDDLGVPIDRYGPRYARYDFPIITGLNPLIRAARAGTGTPLKEGLHAGVDVTRVLAEKLPSFYARVSTIDISDPGMIVLLLEDLDYELRLSREDYLRNIQNYFALRPRLEAAEGPIVYVDLRWQDRVTVWPASALIEKDGGM